jgi:hypothetical protein
MASGPERNSQNLDDGFHDAPGRNSARGAADVAAESGGGDFLDDTIAVWQPLSQRPLTREDAREITENMVGFFSVLREWAEAERNPEKGLPPPPPWQPGRTDEIEIPPKKLRRKRRNRRRRRRVNRR